MNKISLGTCQASAMAMGCMRLADRTEAEAALLINSALSMGVNLFDHADIYGGGRSEEIFGRVLADSPSLRDYMLLQSKCGIRKGCYDFSDAHIVTSVEGSLQRLHTDHLDILLLHRPDVLAEPEEFARAIETLKAHGKVLNFGVSNMNPAQIQLLESWTGEKMVADQLQLSLMHAGMVTSCLNVNVPNAEGTMYDGSVLPYAQRRDLAIQAWSPLQYGMFKGCFVGNPQFPELNACLEELARAYGVTPAAIALAWILRIPGKLQVILGTVNPKHLEEALKAADIQLTRAHWYRLYRACGYSLP